MYIKAVNPSMSINPHSLLKSEENIYDSKSTSFACYDSNKCIKAVVL